jgi:hypothetical protein
MCDVFINKRALGGRHTGAPGGRQEKSVGRPFHMCVLSLRATAVRVRHHHQQPTWRQRLRKSSRLAEEASSMTSYTPRTNASWPLCEHRASSTSGLALHISATWRRSRRSVGRDGLRFPRTLVLSAVTAVQRQPLAWLPGTVRIATVALRRTSRLAFFQRRLGPVSRVLNWVTAVQRQMSAWPPPSYWPPQHRLRQLSTPCG